MSFQENLKYYREKAGYKTAKELADVLKLPYNTYAGYESKGRENNILGMNEDERLKKELDEIFLSIMYLHIQVVKINTKFVYFEIGFKEQISEKTTCSTPLDVIRVAKKDVIKFINEGEILGERLKQINISNSIISRIVIIAKLKLEIEINAGRKEFLKYKDIVSSLKNKPIEQHQEKLASFFKKLDELTAYWIDRQYKFEKLWKIYQKNKKYIRIEKYKTSDDNE